MDFLIPGFMGTLTQFRKDFDEPLCKKEIPVEFIGDKLRKKIDYYLLRRDKTDVLKDLPVKTNHVIKKKMSLKEQSLYLDSLKQIMDFDLSTKGIVIILKAIQFMRSLSDHPLIHYPHIKKYSVEKLIEMSAKLTLTSELLDQIQERGEKVIIFSQFKKTQALLAEVCLEKFGFSPCIVSGQTPVYKRQFLIDEFQKKEGFNIIIMSPFVAGFGFNITGANNIIHYSRHWNPAKEEQANDRIYRIGQTKGVNIYLPIGETEKFRAFDIIIHELLEKKRVLSKAFLCAVDFQNVSDEELFKELKNSFSNVDFENDKIDDDYFEEFSRDALIYGLEQNLLNKGYEIVKSDLLNPVLVPFIAIKDNKVFIPVVLCNYGLEQYKNILKEYKLRFDNITVVLVSEKNERVFEFDTVFINYEEFRINPLLKLISMETDDNEISIDKTVGILEDAV